MNKKIFAIIMIIALILSSFSLAFANDNDENKEKKEKTENRKIHVHLETEKDNISQVFVIINDEKIELTANGNSGNYSVSKGGDLVSNTLTEIIIIYSSNEEESFNPAKNSQQGQEGQGSVNYRISVTEAVEIDDNDYIDENNEDIDNVKDTHDGNTNEEEDEDMEDIDDTEESTNIPGKEVAIEGEGDLIGENNGDNNEENTADTSTDSSDATPGDNTPDITDNNTISIATEDETPLGVPEPQEIASSEETTAEDEETPLDIPSTGVATPLLYGAGALISLLGLLKRR